MGLPVNTVASGGLPVGDMTSGNKFGMAISEAKPGYGVAVTKVTGGGGMPVVYETIGAFTPTTWNPSDKGGLIGFTNGNLTVTASGFNTGTRSLASEATGKFYFECTFTTWAGSNDSGIGLSLASVLPGNFYNSQAGTIFFYQNGTVANNGSSAGLSFGSRANGDIIGIAVDLGAKLVWFRIAPSGNWNTSGTANPATGAGGISISAISTGSLFAAISLDGSGQQATANFGASAFSGTVPSGFTAGWG